MTHPPLNHFHALQLGYFRWRQQAAVAQKIMLALTMACLTGIAAQVAVPLPFTPVPVTGQTFAVLLAGVSLGKNWGALSQMIYVLLGGLGMPWFAGHVGGTAALFGPTGGYLFGFVITAFVLGYVVDRDVRVRHFRVLLPFMLACNLIFIFLPGLLGLALWFGFAQGQWPTLNQVLVLGFYPFVPGAIVKTVLAAGLGCFMLPCHVEK